MTLYVLKVGAGNGGSSLPWQLAPDAASWVLILDPIQQPVSQNLHFNKIPWGSVQS